MAIQNAELLKKAAEEEKERREEAERRAKMAEQNAEEEKERREEAEKKVIYNNIHSEWDKRLQAFIEEIKNIQDSDMKMEEVKDIYDEAYNEAKKLLSFKIRENPEVDECLDEILRNIEVLEDKEMSIETHVPKGVTPEDVVGRDFAHRIHTKLPTFNADSFHRVASHRLPCDIKYHFEHGVPKELLQREQNIKHGEAHVIIAESGAGKTAHFLRTLCHNYGIYWSMTHGGFTRASDQDPTDYIHREFISELRELSNLEKFGLIRSMTWCQLLSRLLFILKQVDNYSTHVNGKKTTNLTPQQVLVAQVCNVNKGKALTVYHYLKENHYKYLPQEFLQKLTLACLQRITDLLPASYISEGRPLIIAVDECNASKFNSFFSLNGNFNRSELTIIAEVVSNVASNSTLLTQMYTGTRFNLDLSKIIESAVGKVETKPTVQYVHGMNLIRTGQEAIDCFSKIIHLDDKVKEYLNSTSFEEEFLPGRMRFIGNTLYFLSNYKDETMSLKQRFHAALTHSLHILSSSIRDGIKQKLPDSSRPAEVILKSFLKSGFARYILANLLHQEQLEVKCKDMYNTFHAVGLATGISSVKSNGDEASISFDTTEPAAKRAVLSLLDDSDSIREPLKIAVIKELLSASGTQNDRTLLEKFLGIQLLGDAEPFASTLRRQGFIGRQTRINIQRMGTPSQLFPGVTDCQMWRGILAGESRFFNVVIYLCDKNHNDAVLALKSSNGQVILLFFSCKAQNTGNRNVLLRTFVGGALSTNPYSMYVDSYKKDQSLRALNDEPTSFNVEHNPFPEEVGSWSSFQQEFESMTKNGGLKYMRILVHAHPEWSIEEEWKSNDKYWVVDNDSHTMLFNQEIWSTIMTWLRSLPISKPEESQSRGQKRRLVVQSSKEDKRQKHV